MIKTSISDHFPIFASICTSTNKNEPETFKVKRRNFNDENQEWFKTDLASVDWTYLKSINDTEQQYEYVLNVFSDL